MEPASSDKYNDPRAAITARGIAIAIGVLLLGIAGAALSIHNRRTRLEQTTVFWGDQTILGLQLAERIELRVPSGDAVGTVDLTGTPGLGHLRRLLLDERNYDWPSESREPAWRDCPPNRVSPENSDDPDHLSIPAPRCIQLRLTDPTGKRIETIDIDLDLVEGWVGPSDGSRRVRISERSQPKIANYFSTIIRFEQKRYDFRP